VRIHYNSNSLPRGRENGHMGMNVDYVAKNPDTKTTVEGPKIPSREGGQPRGRSAGPKSLDAPRGV